MPQVLVPSGCTCREQCFAIVDWVLLHAKTPMHTNNDVQDAKITRWQHSSCSCSMFFFDVSQSRPHHVIMLLLYPILKCDAVTAHTHKIDEQYQGNCYPLTVPTQTPNTAPQRPLIPMGCIISNTEKRAGGDCRHFKDSVPTQTCPVGNTT